MGETRTTLSLCLATWVGLFFGTPSLADDLPISICCAFWWYFLLSIVFPASNTKMLWFFFFWCVTTLSTWIFSSQGGRTRYLLPPPLLWLLPIIAQGWRFFCCVDEQDSCVTTDVARKEADLRYILECKCCLRSTTIFLLPLGNLAVAVGGVNAHPLSDHHFTLPQSFMAASSEHRVHSWCLICSAGKLNDALYCSAKPVGVFIVSVWRNGINNVYVTLLSCTSPSPL